MRARWVILALTALVIKQAETVAFHYRMGTSYVLCNGFAAGIPIQCIDVTGVHPSGTSHKIRLRRCAGFLAAYNLIVDTSMGGIEQIFQIFANNPLDNNQGFDSVTAFDIWCDDLFFVNGADIHVQDLNPSNIITKRLYTAESAIQHMEVGGDPKHYIFFSIDGEGLFRISFDGNNREQLVSYDAGTIIIDLDYCQASNKFVIVAGAVIYLYDATPFTGAPTALTSVPEVPTGGDTITAAAIGMLAGSSDYILASFSSGQNPIKSYTGTGLTFTEATDDAYTPDDLAICASDADCGAGCTGDGCACEESTQFRTCCNGLCVERDLTPDNFNDFNCFCRCDDTHVAGDCSATDLLDPYPEECPDDITAAIVCPASSRDQSFSVYALTQIYPTKICSVDQKGNPAPLPEMAIPLSVRAPCSGYQFPPTIKPPERYGRYVTSYDVVGDREVSLEFIAQEGNEARYPEYSTVSAEVGTCAKIRVWVSRQCNVKLIRWQFGKKRLDQFKGKPVLTIKSVKESDEGVYEVYFRNARKAYRVSFVRLIVYTPPANPATCTNGGVSSLYGEYCICPPGRVGIDCANLCPEGMFGSLGVCSYSCQDRFNLPDCGEVLFCQEDPFGCECYLGYKKPGCTPCPSGWYGRNCKEECTCAPRDCNPITGCP